MKLLKSFFLIAVLVTFTGCSSDDDGGTSQLELTLENLVGTYEYTSITDSSVTTVTVNGVTADFSTFESESSLFTDAFMTLNADGTFTSTGNYVDNYTTTIIGQSPVSDSEIVPLDGSGTYTINTDERTITFAGDVTYEVTLFNESELRLVENYVELIDDNQTDTGRYEIRFTKQN